jgi:hypothetical protein
VVNDRGKLTEYPGVGEAVRQVVVDLRVASGPQGNLGGDKGVEEIVLMGNSSVVTDLADVRADMTCGDLKSELLRAMVSVAYEEDLLLADMEGKDEGLVVDVAERRVVIKLGLFTGCIDLLRYVTEVIKIACVSGNILFVIVRDSFCHILRGSGVRRISSDQSRHVGIHVGVLLGELQKRAEVILVRMADHPKSHVGLLSVGQIPKKLFQIGVIVTVRGAEAAVDHNETAVGQARHVAHAAGGAGDHRAGGIGAELGQGDFIVFLLAHSGEVGDLWSCLVKDTHFRTVE